MAPKACGRAFKSLDFGKKNPVQNFYLVNGARGCHTLWMQVVRKTITGGVVNKAMDLESRSVGDLWSLHELVLAELSRKITAERARLDDRLRHLGSVDDGSASRRRRRPYPKVLPKYRNPKNQSETWAGRGKQPRWLAAQLRSGKKLSDFLIRRQRA